MALCVGDFFLNFYFSIVSFSVGVLWNCDLACVYFAEYYTASKRFLKKIFQNINAEFISFNITVMQNTNWKQQQWQMTKLKRD